MQEQIAPLGIVRLVRNLFAIAGMAHFGPTGQLDKVRLNAADSYSRMAALGLAALFTIQQVGISLGQI